MKNFALVQTIGSGILLLYTIVLWGLPVAPALAVFDFITDLSTDRFKRVELRCLWFNHRRLLHGLYPVIIVFFRNVTESNPREDSRRQDCR